MWYQRLFEFAAFLIEGLMIYYYGQHLFELKKSRLKTLLYTFAAFSILFSAFLLSIPILNTVLSLIIYFLIFHFLFLCSKKNAVFHSALLVVLMIVTEFISIALTTLALGKDFNNYLGNDVIFAINLILSKMVYFMLLVIIAKISNRKKTRYHKDSLFSVLLIAPVSSVFIITALFDAVSQTKTTLGESWIYLVSTLLLLISNLIFFFAFDYFTKSSEELMEFRSMEQKVEIDRTYFEILEKNNENARIFSHDMNNHLSHIVNLAQNDEVTKYVSTLYGEIKNYSHTAGSQNKTLDVIIDKYITLCANKKIGFSYDIKTANLAFMEATDLTAFLNNLLDNAVEAAEKSEAKFVNLRLYTKNNSIQVVGIENSCDTAPKTKKGRLITQKEKTDFHGIGFKSIEKVVNKYNGCLDWTFNEQKHEFETKIIF